MKKLALLILINLLYFNTTTKNPAKLNNEYAIQRTVYIENEKTTEKNNIKIQYAAKKAQKVTITKQKKEQEKRTTKISSSPKKVKTKQRNGKEIDSIININPSFSTVLSKHKSDIRLFSKLESYLKNGIENKFELNNITVEQFIDTAKNYLGTPYGFGSSTKKRVDCSGLLYATFTDLGIKTPRDAQGFSRYGTIVTEIDNLQRGDLVFFVKTYRTSKVITHTGIYLGDNNFIHATRRAGVAIISIQEKYYKERFVFGTRIF